MPRARHERQPILVATSGAPARRWIIRYTSKWRIAVAASRPEGDCHLGREVEGQGDGVAHYGLLSSLAYPTEPRRVQKFRMIKDVIMRATCWDAE